MNFSFLCVCQHESWCFPTQHTIFLWQHWFTPPIWGVHPSDGSYLNTLSSALTFNISPSQTHVIFIFVILQIYLSCFGHDKCSVNIPNIIGSRAASIFFPRTLFFSMQLFLPSGKNTAKIYFLSIKYSERFHFFWPSWETDEARIWRNSFYKNEES